MITETSWSIGKIALEKEERNHYFNIAPAKSTIAIQYKSFLSQTTLKRKITKKKNHCIGLI
jgi:hypothetical protein